AHAVFHRPARHGLRCELRSERRRLARPLEAHVAGRRPGDRVPLLTGDADNRVVEGRLDVRNPVRDVLALTPLGPSSAGGRLRHAGLLAVSSRCWFGSVLAGPLLPGNGLAGTLAGTGVGPGALAVHRQPTTVAQSLVAADLDLALDVGGDLAAEVTLDLQVLVDVRADTSDLFVGEIAHPGLHGKVDRLADVLRGRAADAVDIGERDAEVLLARDVDTGNSGHGGPLLALTLLVAGVRADDPDAPVATDHLALLAHLLDTRSYLHAVLTCSGR